MSSLIKIKRSAVSGKKPQLADLQVGELALNTYDGSLFIKRDTGGVGIATTVSNLSPWTESFGASSISYVSGNVGVGTDVFTDPVRIANDKKLAVGVATAYQVFAQIFSGTSGVGPNTTGSSTQSGANIAIGDTFTGNTFNNADYNYRNISIGNCAGCCLNNGVKNVFIGDQAGRNITDGDKNVVIGETAVGGNPGNPSATGNENFIVGDSAGFNLTSGSHNIIFGDQSGGFTSTGGCNIMIGRRSGMGNLTGSGNIILGQFAGYSNGNGSDNILIGTCAMGARLNPSKTLVIGHYNHQWIHGDSNYNIGIGITNPSIAVVGAGDTQKLAVGILSAYNIFSNQLNITGVSTFNGTVDLNAGLDIDGQLDVDELVVAGVSTFNNTVDINSTLDVDGDTQLDDLTVAGFATFTSNASFAGNVSIAGTLSYEDVSNVDAIGIITAGHGLRVTKGGIDVAAGISTFAGNILANGNLIGDTATNISGINSVTATAFFGDGSGLENTGATLSAASGSQRLVVTSLTSGTMTSAATDADLAFNATSNLLSTGKLNVSGLTTISNLKVDSGIVTAVSGIATYNGDLVIGTPSAGFKSGAFSINTTDKTKDSINELNFILGKLVPDPPDTINGASFTLSGLGNGRLCAGFTPVNNTGGSHAVAAGRQYSRNTDSTVTSNTLTEFGPGDSETVTGFVNAVGVGTTTLTVGVNNGTFDKLVISNNEDASNSSRNPGITSQFYEIYDARLLNAASPDGFNKAFISQGISTTTSAFWYEDPSTVSAPVISFSPVTYPASPTLSYSSGIPHYTQASANAFTYALGVENASGDMYTQNSFVNSDGQTSGFQNPGDKSYTNFTGGTNPPARNYGVGAAVTTQISQQPRDLHLTATSNVFTSFDASTPYGSHNNQRVGFTTDVNIMGTTARTNKIDEDNILITSLGTGSGNATRVNAGSTGDNPSPVFTAWGGGSAGSIATYEAAVRGAVLRHDQTDYSDGSYLPVGPDYSGSRSGTQYFQIELIRSNVSEFRISYTGSAAGCFVCMPQNSAWTTSLSGVNGWADMFQAYKGSGIPTSAEPGCSSGGLMDNDGGTFTCVFGTESSSNDTGNRILIRWKLTSGQSITAMSFTAT